MPSFPDGQKAVQQPPPCRQFSCSNSDSLGHQAWRLGGPAAGTTCQAGSGRLEPQRPPRVQLLSREQASVSQAISVFVCVLSPTKSILSMCWPVRRTGTLLPEFMLTFYETVLLVNILDLDVSICMSLYFFDRL